MRLLARTRSAVAADLTAARAGDIDALERLLLHFGPQVRQTLEINPKWRSVIEADDIMQVTYMEAFTRIGQFVGTTTGAFANWLRQIASHNLRDAIRALERRKRPQPERRVSAYRDGTGYLELLTVLGVTSTTASRVAAANEAHTLIERALGLMPERYAAAIRLFDLEGLSGPDVAARLGCSRVTAFLLRARGRDMLRELLGPASRILSDRG